MGYFHRRYSADAPSSTERTGYPASEQGGVVYSVLGRIIEEGIARLRPWPAHRAIGQATNGRDVPARSKALRDILDEYDAGRTGSERLRPEYGERRVEVEERRTGCECILSYAGVLRGECEAGRTKRDQRGDQLIAIHRRQDDVTVLVASIETDRAIAERRERPRREPMWRREQVWVFGTDDSSSSS